MVDMAIVRAHNVKIEYDGIDITHAVIDPDKVVAQIDAAILDDCREWSITIGDGLPPEMDDVEWRKLSPAEVERFVVDRLVDAHVQAVLKRMEEILTDQ